MINYDVNEFPRLSLSLSYFCFWELRARENKLSFLHIKIMFKFLLFVVLVPHAFLLLYKKDRVFLVFFFH